MANQPTKYSKFLVGAASAALVASAVAPVASAADFSDVKGNTHEEAINALSDAGIIKGYEDGSFKPNKTLTRSDVVKMMGKWLVSEGASIPEDAVSNPRFTDLTSSSNKELLEYAAVVKDAGVFVGSNGKLLAADNITRENMALVLVRAFDEVNGIDLVAYVNEQDFNKDVKDLSAAKEEARGAINVLDFFDITNPAVANFNPKGSTTRGHFATFLHKSINADFSVVAVGAVKAINATTVEVTFEEDVTDINSLKFTIEGLEVKNAAVKQTDAKTVVLTTATQEGGKKYSVKLGDAKIGEFTGISAVIPEKVTMVTTSLQGIVGQEVTVKADINVKAAGVPVTFNIVSNNRSISKDHVVEAYTDENGIAEYSYTQYAANSEDTVLAYATGKANARTNGKVYWANAIQLAVSEITAGNDLSNESKKSYKVAGKKNTTYYIAIKENLDVAPDKLTDVKVQNHGTQNFVTPYELSTGGTSFASVTTNSNGEGSFTVYGTNLEATPIVYLPSSVHTDLKDFSYSALALQAQAPTVKFSQVDRLAVAVVGEGTADSAEYASIPVAYNQNSAGGRTYTVTVTDKEGKVAPAGTVAYVAFAENNISGDVYFTTGNANFEKVVKNDVKAVTVGKDGKVQFRVAGKGATTYVKPTVFLNTAGDVSPAKLDKADVQVVADVTYFKSPVVTNAALTVTDQYGRTISSLNANDDAYFTYQSVDQNGFAYKPGNYTTTPGGKYTIYVQDVDANGNIIFVPKEVEYNPITSNTYVLAFDVTSTFGNAVVKDANGVVLPAIQNLGSTKTYHVNSNADGKAVVRVTSQTADTVSVNVTGASNILPTQTASVSFVNSILVPDLYSGTVESYNSRTGTLKFAGKQEVDLYGANIFYTKGNEVIANYDAFIDILKNATGTVSITRTVNKDGVTTFNIYNVSTTGTKPVDTFLAVDAIAKAKAELEAAVATAKTAEAAAVEGTEKGQYAVGSKAVYVTAIEAAAAAAAKADATVATLDAAKAVLATAKAAFEAGKVVEVTPEPSADFTFTSQTGLVNKVIAQAATYDIAGTVAKEVGDVASVVVAFGTVNLKEVPATYDAATGAFEFKGNGSTQDTVIVIAKDATGKELARTTLTIDFK